MSDDEDEYEYEYDEDDDGGDGGNNDEDMEEDNDNNNNDDDDDDNGDFEYTDDEEPQDDAEVALENAYYNAKGLREVDLSEAATALENVIVQEQNELSKNGSSYKYGQWSYKAMKQLVKLHLRAAMSLPSSSNNIKSSSSSSSGTMGSPTMIIQQYNRLLECVSVGSDVSPAAVENGISRMLERVARAYASSSSSSNNSNFSYGRSTSMSDDTNNNVMTDGDEQQQSDNNNPQSLALAVYDATLTVFHPVTGPCKNERLWFKTNLKYGQLLYEINETAKLQQVLKDLLVVHNANNNNNSNERNIMNASSGTTTNNSTNSMEIYALQIQLYSKQKDYKKLRETYNRAINVMGGIPHPRTLALIHELGGKMHMMSREYENAGKTFFQAFKSYDEAGDISRLRCLKYLVLASMLHASTINPFDSQEARPYRDDPEIVAMTELVSAFHNNKIKEFEGILKKNSKQLMGDEFIREHIEDLLRTIRTQVLRRVIRPYSRISLGAIATELNDIPVHDVEQLLVHLILSGALDGKIDRINNVLLKQPEKGPPTSTDSTTGQGDASSNVTSSGGAQSSKKDTSSSSTSAGGANKKSEIVVQCEIMDEMMKLLDDLSAQVTNTSHLLSANEHLRSAGTSSYGGPRGSSSLRRGGGSGIGISSGLMGMAAF